MSVQGERNFNPILQMHLVSRVHVCFSSLPLLQPGRQSTDYNVSKSSDDELMINKCKLKFQLSMGFVFFSKGLAATKTCPVGGNQCRSLSLLLDSVLNRL